MSEVMESRRDVPRDVLKIIAARGSGLTRPLAEQLAGRVLMLQGTTLEAQNSKGDARYFRIRHVRHGRAVAYVNVYPAALTIHYLLPRDYPVTGAEERRDNTQGETGYGITLKVPEGDLSDALRLLRDAIDAHD
jgi:hypothetical protein